MQPTAHAPLHRAHPHGRGHGQPPSIKLPYGTGGAHGQAGPKPGDPSNELWTKAVEKWGSRLGTEGSHPLPPVARGVDISAGERGGTRVARALGRKVQWTLGHGNRT